MVPGMMPSITNTAMGSTALAEKCLRFCQTIFRFSSRETGISPGVTMLLGSELGTAYPSAEERTEEPAKPFALPPANKDMRRVFAYLIKHRGIARDVVAHFAKAGLLYEDAEY
ncbi:MAG: DUF3991 domain-containing protein, partial [Clostridiales bacterium]|nr:DUF3991 domain-containing protein [Clostridiales bacterium]